MGGDWGSPIACGILCSLLQLGGASTAVLDIESPACPYVPYTLGIMVPECTKFMQGSSYQQCLI